MKDKDGPGGHDPRPRTKFRLRGGKHRWFVRAWDYAGNKRTSRAFARLEGAEEQRALRRASAARAGSASASRCASAREAEVKAKAKAGR